MYVSADGCTEGFVMVLGGVSHQNTLQQNYTRPLQIIKVPLLTCIDDSIIMCSPHRCATCSFMWLARRGNTVRRQISLLHVSVVCVCFLCDFRIICICMSGWYCDAWSCMIAPANQVRKREIVSGELIYIQTSICTAQINHVQRTDKHTHTHTYTHKQTHTHTSRYMLLIIMRNSRADTELRHFHNVLRAKRKTIALIEIVYILFISPSHGANANAKTHNIAIPNNPFAGSAIVRFAVLVLRRLYL